MTTPINDPKLIDTICTETGQLSDQLWAIAGQFTCVCVDRHDMFDVPLFGSQQWYIVTTYALDKDRCFTPWELDMQDSQRVGQIAFATYDEAKAEFDHIINTFAYNDYR